MAASTTLKLPEELKARVASAAEVDAGGALYAMEDVRVDLLAALTGMANMPPPMMKHAMPVSPSPALPRRE